MSTPSGDRPVGMSAAAEGRAVVEAGPKGMEPPLGSEARCKARAFSRGRAVIVCITLASLLGGCGGGSGATSFNAGRANALAGSVELGTPINAVIERLGEPVSRSGEGADEELNYGTWQLEFEEGRLVRRVRVRVPASDGKPSSTRGGFKGIEDLKPGTMIGKVVQEYGRAEEVYEILEGDDEEVVVLRYGEWELTFVDGRLDQRFR